MSRIITGRSRAGRTARAGLLVFLLLAGLLPPAAQAAPGDEEYERGQQAEQRRDYDEAYRQYMAAWQADPENPSFFMAYERMKFQASSLHIENGHKLRDAGSLADALTEYEMAAAIDPGSPVARQSLEIIRTRIQEANQPGGMPLDEPGMPSLRDALGPPELQPLSRAPINLQVTNDSRVVVETIARLAGINALFDQEYTSRRITVELSNVTLEEALNQVAIQTKTFWKPLSRNTILVMMDTAVKRREQEQQIIKTFYLSNTITPQELTEVITAIRTLLETRRIQQINSMNAIILRDTPDKVALAEKIIRDVDKAKAEVVVDVAVLEVRRDFTRQLGLALGNPGISISAPFTPEGNAEAGTIPLNRLDKVDTGDWSINLPGAQLNALLSDNTTKILQRPQVRASDGMKATLRIGDKVPIATGAYQPGVAGQAVSALVQTQFQYIDVGVNVDITPKVHANREITLKVRIEVSAVTSTAEPVPGVRQPVIGQRVIEHDIRLREGEVNILGGILQTGLGEQVSGIPGLSQIPLLRYLFSNVSKSIAEDEVLIVLRPHTVRVQDITPLNLRAIDIGTEGDVRLRRPSELPEPGAEPAAPTPQGAPQGAPPAAPAAVPGPAASNGSGEQAASAPAHARFLVSDAGSSHSAGETFEVPVRLENGRDIFEVPFELQFDTAALKLVGVKKGDFWASDNQPVAIVERMEEENGRALVTMTRPPGSGGISGEGTLAVLTFEAMRPGATELGIFPAGVRTPANGFIPVQGAQATVTIR